MPRLANERQELYARARATGALPAKSAVMAGFSTGSAIYSKLEEDPDILSRIVELTEEINLKREQQREAARESARVVGQVTGVGKAWVISQFAENAQLARNAGDFKSSNEAIKEIKGILDEAGGTSPESSSMHIDLDNIEALTNVADKILNPPKEIGDPMMEAERAIQLIGGSSSKSVKPKDRIITTGSETDIAFTEHATPDDE